MRPSFAIVRELARKLPSVEYGGGAGSPALKVKGRLLAWLRDDPDILAVKVSPINREYLLQFEPETFFVTDHYRDYPIVLVRLSRIDRPRLAELWRRPGDRWLPSVCVRHTMHSTFHLRRDAPPNKRMQLTGGSLLRNVR